MYYYLAAAELAKGHTDSTLFWLDHRAAFQFTQHKDQALTFRLQLLRANVLNRKNERAKALELQLAGLQQAEARNDTLAIAYFQNFLAATYLNTGDRVRARQALQNGLQILGLARDRERAEIYATLQSNKALWFASAPFDSLPLLRDSIRLAAENLIKYSANYGFHWLQASGLSIRAMQHVINKNYDSAEKDFISALNIHERIGDPLYVVHDLERLGALYYVQKKYDTSIHYFNRAIRLEQNSQNHENLSSLYSALSAAYRAKGDMKSYAEHLEKLIINLDSSNRINSAGKIAEIESKYQVQKIETELARQKLNLYRQNLLFYGLTALVLAITAAGWLGFKRFKRKQAESQKFALEKAEKALVEARENERRRIAADLHDHLGIQAHTVLYHAEQLREKPADARKLSDQLHDTAREMLYNLRETVWALKHEEVTADVLWVRIIHFCQRTASQFPNTKILAQGSKPSSTPFGAERSLNVMMIVMEAMNNALRHANANTIIVQSEPANDEWVIHIQDNGKGFQLGKNSAEIEGNGLQNMKQRASKMGATFKITTAQEMGSAVMISIPLKHIS